MPKETIGQNTENVALTQAKMPETRQEKGETVSILLNSFDQRYAEMPDDLVNIIAEKMAIRGQDALFGTSL